jgi:UDP:flavonoid glycosyltransferase YjiC (YdhE family)
MKVLMITVGSAGDVHPFIGVGLALKARGHEVRIATNPHFKARIRSAGLGFYPLGTIEDYNKVIHDPRLVREFASPRLVIDELIHGSVRPTVELTKHVIEKWRPDVIVRHHISLGSRWVAKDHGIPTATLVLAPAFFFSRQDPAAYRSWESLNASPFMTEVKMQIARRVMRWFMDRPLNRIRRELGMEPGRDFLFGEVKDGNITLGMWSKHLRGRAVDDPERSFVCGYSFFDRSPEDEAGQAELYEFLARCEDAGTQPAVFTLGTSVVQHAGDFYPMAVRACEKIGMPAVLLVGKPENVPTGLPPSIHACMYAPFSKVLHRGSVTIHHAGAGTTAQTLRSGRPSIAVPFANDEFDNAARIERLGTSMTIRRGKLNERTLVDALERARSDREMQMRAGIYRGVLGVEDGARTAAEKIESLAYVTSGVEAWHPG